MKKEINFNNLSEIKDAVIKGVEVEVEGVNDRFYFIFGLDGNKLYCSDGDGIIVSNDIKNVEEFIKWNLEGVDSYKVNISNNKSNYKKLLNPNIEIYDYEDIK